MEKRISENIKVVDELTEGVIKIYFSFPQDGYDVVFMFRSFIPLHSTSKIFKILARRMSCVNTELFIAIKTHNNDKLLDTANQGAFVDYIKLRKEHYHSIKYMTKKIMSEVTMKEKYNHLSINISQSLNQAIQLNKSLLYSHVGL